MTAETGTAAAAAAGGIRISVALAVAPSGFRLELDLALPGRGVSALFGRSGAGKTKALRLLAGLERAPGAIHVLGDCWQDSARGLHVPTHRRGVGYVFQEPSLFPHLTVSRNLDYARKRRPRRERADKSPTVVDLLGLGSLLARFPEQLSGGERQRVAIGRALLAAPRLLLLDEPLAALDAPRKQEIFPYLERLRDELSIPIIYVSHSLEEIARLADHLVVLEAGRVTAAGPLGAVLARVDLARTFADEAGVVIDGEVAAHHADDHLSEVAFPGGRLWVAARHNHLGTRVRARVLARDVSLALERPGPSSILNILPARIAEIADEGPDRVMVRLELGDPKERTGEGTPSLLARITRRSREALALRPGQEIFAQVKSVALVA